MEYLFLQEIWSFSILKYYRGKKKNPSVPNWVSPDEKLQKASELQGALQRFANPTHFQKLFIEHAT